MNLFRKKNPSDIIHEDQESLVKNLSFTDLTSMGVAAVIGAGIFATIGRAAFDGGPAVSLLFIFTAIACLFSAFCYAQFASAVPKGGSAYTYAYVAFGEIVAWIIGWDLLMEYAIGNIAVAISWSDYFTSLLNTRIHFPEYLSVDYLSAEKFYKQCYGNTQECSGIASEGYRAWVSAPQVAGFRIILDAPALMINLIISVLVYIGIKESKTTGNILVLIKLAAILLVIVAGAFYIDTKNWVPFAPNGLPGILKGVSAVFFAYIGFDAISTTAEECRDARRDLPRAMIWSLLICTVIYIVISLVMTGMVSYTELNLGDPLAYVFARHNLHFLSGIIAVSAVVAMTSVLLVFQIGQPRILLNMSRDRLLPEAFSRVHKKFRTPSFATVITGIMVAVPILFLNHTIVTDLCSIGTLFAFAIVCAGVMVKENKEASFKIPYYNSRYLMPLAFLMTGSLLYFFNRENLITFFESFHMDKFTTWIFLLYATVMLVLCIVKNLSFIPAAGLTCNLYLISELGLTNWVRFGIWLVVGLVVYFLYRIWKNL